MQQVKNVVIFLCLTFFVVSCGEVSYYDKITKNNTGIVRGANLNDSMDDIRKVENNKFLTREDNDFLEYEYELDYDDKYVISYLFDVAGCYEIGLDTYFTESNQAQLVMDGFKSQFIEKFGEPTETNKLCEWRGNNGAISIELDYNNLERGMVSVTAFANE